MKNRNLFFPAADERQDDIWRYSCEMWGEAVARQYITGLHKHLQALADKKLTWRTLDALIPRDVELMTGVYVSRYQKHLVFFRKLDTRTMGVMSLLHVSMDIPQRLAEDLLSPKSPL